MDEIIPSRKQFSPAPPILVPYEISPRQDEDEDEEAEEIDEETAAVLSSMDLRIPPPITESQASAARRRRVCKRKKGKGKRKSKPSAKKQQMIESMLQVLRRNLNPVPFIPRKTLDFAGRENLLKKLGLWEFVHIDFDRTIRVEFIAQLVANYNAKSRASHVNGCRIRVNRSDLARACKLPLQSKMNKSNAGGAEDLDWEVLSDDSIRFVMGLLSNWLLLHEDLYLMPQEVALWMKMIRKGHPEKVDWAGLLWLMVEKELTQGSELRDCYYASHLQQLIKFQHEKLFLIEEPVKNVVGLVAGATKEVEDGDNGESVRDSDAVESGEKVGEGDPVVHGLSTELTLGQDDEKEEGGKDEEGEGEGVKDLETMDAEKCNHSVLQRCISENAGVEDFLEGDGLTGNFLRGMEGNQMAVSLQEQHRNSGKRRVTEQDHPSNYDNKRMRMNETLGNIKPLDFGMCMDQIQEMSQRARMLYEEEKEQWGMQREMLLNEVQKRDDVIAHLHKGRMEETQKKDFAIKRLEHELYLMGSVVDGYRKALKESREAFAKAGLAEEATYKDAEMEKKEEEFGLYLEQREVEEEYAEKTNVLPAAAAETIEAVAGEASKHAPLVVAAADHRPR